METTDEDLIKEFTSRTTIWFGLVICDEVHILKNADFLTQREAKKKW